MQAVRLVEALKRLLKAQGITYAQVAAKLGLSEAGVKRMFSRRDFTLQRLEHICRVAHIEFDELARAASDDRAGIARLTPEQERALVSDPKLMLVALCAVGNWTFEQIVDTYAIPRAECVRCLTHLDRQRIIELAPGNRIRPLISRTFSWLPDGPIQRYFRARVEAEYLRASSSATTSCSLRERHAVAALGVGADRPLARGRARIRGVASRRHRAAIGRAPRHEPPARYARLGAARIPQPATR
jgi:transcriptional regulator with XRE-family HTH domain